MVEELFVLLALGGAVVASITDIKSRIIPNKLTFSLIGIGIFGYLVAGLFTDNLMLFMASVKSLIVMFVAGYLFWMLGAWSAGDAKEFLFIAALIPMYPAFLLGTFNPAIASYPFIITVFINTFLAIFPIVFIYSLYLSVKKKIIFKFTEPLKEIKKFIEMSFVVTGAIAVSTFFPSKILVLVALVLLYRIQRNYRLSISALLVLAYIFLRGENIFSQVIFVFTNFAFVLLLMLLIRIVLSSINTVRKEALQEEVKITGLLDGDIIAEEIYTRQGEVIRDNRGMLEKIKDAAKTGAMDVLRKKGVGTGAAGVTKKDIEILSGYVENGSLEDRVNLKKSMPFAPVIFVGLVISLVIGDVMLAVRMW